MYILRFLPPPNLFCESLTGRVSGQLLQTVLLACSRVMLEIAALRVWRLSVHLLKVDRKPVQLPMTAIFCHKPQSKIMPECVSVAVSQGAVLPQYCCCVAALEETNINPLILCHCCGVLGLSVDPC